MSQNVDTHLWFGTENADFGQENHAYSVEIKGFAPFSRLTYSKGMPLHFSDTGKFSSNGNLDGGCAYDMFGNQVVLVALALSAKEVWPEILEHECTHVDQLTHPNKPYSLHYDPISFVIEHRLLEAEAFAQHGLKMIYDYKSGLTDKNALAQKLNKSAMAVIVECTTGIGKAHGTVAMQDALDNFIQTDGIDDENRLRARIMFNLMTHRQHKDTITSAATETLFVFNEEIRQYKDNVKQFGEHRTAEAHGYELTAEIFSKPITRHDIIKTINRDEKDRLDSLSSGETDIFIANMRTFSEAQVRLLQKRSANLTL